ncbi:MAG: hypothetical protein H7X85_00670 [Thermoanaerobaculia bacterium]|nr:hypothetical protein [Thermoanaerobaculia bacterium]
MKRVRSNVAAALLVSALAAGCASSSPDNGWKVLEATVVGREHQSPGEGGASYRGTGNYYLVFETREGDATATYTFLVNERQYARYPEGSRVQIIIADNNLREIRPLK